jgi:hypothetical protein
LEEAQARKEEGADGEVSPLGGRGSRRHQALDAIEAESLPLVVRQEHDPRPAPPTIADLLVVEIILPNIWTKPQQELSSCMQDGRAGERTESIKKFRAKEARIKTQ